MYDGVRFRSAVQCATITLSTLRSKTCRKENSFTPTLKQYSKAARRASGRGLAYTPSLGLHGLLASHAITDAVFSNSGQSAPIGA